MQEFHGNESGPESFAQAALDIEMRIRAKASEDPLFCESLKVNARKALRDFFDDDIDAAFEIVPLEQLKDGKLYVVLAPSETQTQSLEKVAVAALKGMSLAACTSSVPGGTCEQTRTCPTTTTCSGYPC